MSDNSVNFYKKFKGQSIAIAFDDTSYEVILDEITEHTYKSPDGGEDTNSFSLIFLTEDKRALSQGTYGLKFGEEVRDIFLVPVGVENGRSLYQAVFN
ncbi:MAG: hypothetical protein CMH98_01210 [Oceanospirillaceae bacterium]|nr:hypothetical protein [Oceanospirillaceae bacterium]